MTGNGSAQPRSYGGWRRSRGVGLLGLGTTATLLLLGVFIVVLITAAVSLSALVVIGPPVLLACAAGLTRVHGSPVLQLVIQRTRWFRASRCGWTRYRADALVTREGGTELPGALSACELLSAEDGYGSRYGLVRDKHTGHLTATLRVVPSSTWLADRADADNWVAGWGSWLASLGYQPMVRHVTVTVDTAPSPGSALADATSAAIDPAAPESARGILATLAAAAPVIAADVDTRMSVTFDPTAAPGKPKALPEAIAETGHALHGLQTQLSSCGLTVAGRCNPADIAGILRGAFDPAARGEISRAVADEQLSWECAGPGGADELWDRYRHGSGVSVSWGWREAPRQNVHADILARLTAPGTFLKRVTLQFRPLPAAAATRVLETEVRAAEFRQEFARRTHRDATARDTFDHARVRQAAMEEAQGAGVVLVSLYVTVTVRAEEDLPRAVAEMETAADTAKIRLQRLYGSQAAGFAAGLPCGVSLQDLARRWRHR